MRATVHYHMDGEAVTLKIEGRLIGPNVPELQRAWQELLPSLSSRKLVVDLRDVQHVDSSGQDLLAKIRSAGTTEFLADTPLTRYFAEQAQQKH